MRLWRSEIGKQIAQLNDPTSPCFLERGSGVLQVSTSRMELSNMLDDPATNLKYAAAYIAMIQKVWQPVLATPAYRSSAAGIVATLYSLGLARSNGTLRLPHANPRMNHFGEVAQRFFDSFEVVEFR